MRRLPVHTLSRRAPYATRPPIPATGSNSGDEPRQFRTVAAGIALAALVCRRRKGHEMPVSSDNVLMKHSACVSVEHAWDRFLSTTRPDIGYKQFDWWSRL